MLFYSAEENCKQRKSIYVCLKSTPCSIVTNFWHYFIVDALLNSNLESFSIEYNNVSNENSKKRSILCERPQYAIQYLVTYYVIHLITFISWVSILRPTL